MTNMSEESLSWCEQARQQGISPLDWLAVWQDKTLADIEAMPPDELKVQLRRWMTIARECLEDGEENHRELQATMMAVAEAAQLKAVLTQARDTIDRAIAPKPL